MWLGLTVGGCFALLYIYQMNQVNSCNDLVTSGVNASLTLGGRPYPSLLPSPPPLPYPSLPTCPLTSRIP